MAKMLISGFGKRNESGRSKSLKEAEELRKQRLAEMTTRRQQALAEQKYQQELAAYEQQKQQALIEQDRQIRLFVEEQRRQGSMFNPFSGKYAWTTGYITSPLTGKRYSYPQKMYSPIYHFKDNTGQWTTAGSVSEVREKLGIVVVGGQGYSVAPDLQKDFIASMPPMTPIKATNKQIFEQSLKIQDMNRQSSAGYTVSQYEAIQQQKETKGQIVADITTFTPSGLFNLVTDVAIVRPLSGEPYISGSQYRSIKGWEVAEETYYASQLPRAEKLKFVATKMGEEAIGESLIFFGGSGAGKMLFAGVSAFQVGGFIKNPTRKGGAELLTLPILYSVSKGVSKISPVFGKLSKKYVPIEETGIKFVEGTTETKSLGKLRSYEGRAATQIHATLFDLKGGDVIKPADTKFLSGWRKALQQRSFYTSAPSYEGKPLFYGGYVGIGKGESGKTVYSLFGKEPTGLIFRDSPVSKTPKAWEKLGAKGLIKLQSTRAGTYVAGENIFGISNEGQFVTSAGLEGKPLIKLSEVKGGELHGKFTYYKYTPEAPSWWFGRYRESKISKGLWGAFTTRNEKIKFKEMKFETIRQRVGSFKEPVKEVDFSITKSKSLGRAVSSPISFSVSSKPLSKSLSKSSAVSRLSSFGSRSSSLKSSIKSSPISSSKSSSKSLSSAFSSSSLSKASSPAFSSRYSSGSRSKSPFSAPSKSRSLLSISSKPSRVKVSGKKRRHDREYAYVPSLTGLLPKVKPIKAAPKGRLAGFEIRPFVKKKPKFI